MLYWPSSGLHYWLIRWQINFDRWPLYVSVCRSISLGQFSFSRGRSSSLLPGESVWLLVSRTFRGRGWGESHCSVCKPSLNPLIFYFIIVSQICPLLCLISLAQIPEMRASLVRFFSWVEMRKPSGMWVETWMFNCTVPRLCLLFSALPLTCTFCRVWCLQSLNLPASQQISHL